MKQVVIIGSGAREHAIAEACRKSQHVGDIGIIGLTRNPALAALASQYQVVKNFDPAAIVTFAKTFHANLVIVGPEAPLAAGVVDALEQAGVATVGPTQAAAQIETSKSFARQLLEQANIPLYPKFAVVTTAASLTTWLKELPGEFVVKPDGLTGGKGVKVQGDHFHTRQEGQQYALECLAKDGRVVVEEKLVGQEFSLMSFSDGEHLLHMPAVQDNKRLQVGDSGPNTGGMGSVSDADHALPFLTPADIQLAQQTNEHVLRALKDRGLTYKGILYGNFMAVKDGLKLIEYNARFGDPEAMNVLSILETDFWEVCHAVAEGTLHLVPAQFSSQATVCKYVVPRGYPDSPVKDKAIDLSEIDHRQVKVFYGALEDKDGALYLTGSRAVAVVGIGQTIAEAEEKVETELKKIAGPVVHRADIGTDALLNARVAHMQAIRQPEKTPLHARA